MSAPDAPPPAAPPSGGMFQRRLVALSKVYLRWWMDGWNVFIRFLFFAFIVGLICYPCYLLFQWLDPEHGAIFSAGLFHLGRLVALAATIIVFPVAYHIASRITGYMKSPR